MTIVIPNAKITEVYPDKPAVGDDAWRVIEYETDCWGGRMHDLYFAKYEQAQETLVDGSQILVALGEWRHIWSGVGGFDLESELDFYNKNLHHLEGFCEHHRCKSVRKPIEFHFSPVRKADQP